MKFQPIFLTLSTLVVALASAALPVVTTHHGDLDRSHTEIQS
ncbi:MAG: hypothetical protein ABWZ88_02665 [Variovorax sp.]